MLQISTMSPTAGDSGRTGSQVNPPVPRSRIPNFIVGHSRPIDADTVLTGLRERCVKAEARDFRLCRSTTSRPWLGARGWHCPIYEWRAVAHSGTRRTVPDIVGHRI